MLPRMSENGDKTNPPTALPSSRRAEEEDDITIDEWTRRQEDLRASGEKIYPTSPWWKRFALWFLGRSTRS